MTMTVVPLKPHLAKFVQTIYGIPAVIPYSDQLYYDFMQCLTKQYYPPPVIDGLIPVKFEIPSRHVERIGHTFLPDQVTFFNQRLIKRFGHDCFSFICYLTSEKGLSRRAAIYKLLERFDLYEEFSYHTLKNMFTNTANEIEQLFPDSFLVQK